MWFHFLVLFIYISPLLCMKSSKSQFLMSSTFIYDQTLLIYVVQGMYQNTNEEIKQGPRYYLVQLDQQSDIQSLSKKEYNNDKLPMGRVAYFFTIKVDDTDGLFTAYKPNKLQGTLDFRPTIRSFDLDKNGTSRYDNPLNELNQYLGTSYTIKGNTLYIFGGILANKNGSFLTRNFFKLDVPSNKTDKLTPQVINSDIPPNAFHSATIVEGNKLVILGGMPYNKLSNIEAPKSGGSIASFYKSTQGDLKYAYVFDTEKEIWKEIETKNSKSGARAGHTATYIPSLKSILVYGGTSNINEDGELYSDIQILNIEDWSWTNHSTTNQDGNQYLVGRAFHSAELIQNTIVFFYGDKFSEDGKASDIMALDLSNLQSKRQDNLIWSSFIGPIKKKEGQNFDTLFNSKVKLSGIREIGEQNNINYGIWIGILYAVIGIITWVFLVWSLTRKYKREKLKKNKISSELMPKPPELLIMNPLPITMPILTPSQPDSKEGDEQRIWELNSHYANSTHAPSLKLNEENSNLLNKIYEKKNNPRHRRWSMQPTKSKF